MPEEQLETISGMVRDVREHEGRFGETHLFFDLEREDGDVLRVFAPSDSLEDVDHELSNRSVSILGRSLREADGTSDGSDVLAVKIMPE
jgi:hypothetical protein